MADSKKDIMNRSRVADGFVSIEEVAEMCGMARKPFYQLICVGHFLSPKHPWHKSRRKYYPAAEAQDTKARFNNE